MLIMAKIALSHAIRRTTEKNSEEGSLQAGQAFGKWNPAAIGAVES